MNHKTNIKTAFCLTALRRKTTEDELLSLAKGNKWIVRRAILLYEHPEKCSRNELFSSEISVYPDRDLPGGIRVQMATGYEIDLNYIDGVFFTKG